MAQMWDTIITHRLLGFSTLSLSLFLMFGFLISFFLMKTIKDFGRYFSRPEEKHLLNNYEHIELLEENPYSSVPTVLGGLQVSSYIDENEPLKIAQTTGSNTTIKGDALEDLVVRIYQGLGYEAHRVDKLIESGEVVLATGSNDGRADVMVISPPSLELLPRKLDADGAMLKDENGNSVPFGPEDYPSETDYHKAVQRTRKRHLIQCKAYAPDANMNDQPVMEIHMAKSLFNADSTEVITTAQDFTAPAIQRAQAVECKLTNRAGLVELIRQHNRVLEDIIKKNKPA